MKKLFALLAGLLLAVGVHAATFNQYGASTGVLKGNASSPQTSAAVSSDIRAMWSGVCSSSTYLRGDGTCAAAVPASAALTKTDDTNVTATLGGSPSTALLSAASITLGWTGTLSVARGGTGTGTLTGPVKGNGTSAYSAALAADIYGLWSGTCNSSSFLRGDGACAAFTSVYATTAAETTAGVTPSSNLYPVDDPRRAPAYYPAPGWVDFGDVPTGVDADTITVPGDKRLRYFYNSRILLKGTTAQPARVLAVAFSSPNTTIDLQFDMGGSLPSSLSAISTLLGAASNTDNTWTVNGNFSATHSYINDSTGSSAVSRLIVGAIDGGSIWAAASSNYSGAILPGSGVSGRQIVFQSTTGGTPGVTYTPLVFGVGDVPVGVFGTSTAPGTLRLLGAQELLRLQGAGATGDAYMSFYRSNNSTQKGYFGYDSGANNNLRLNNLETGDISVTATSGNIGLTATTITMTGKAVIPAPASGIPLTVTALDNTNWADFRCPGTNGCNFRVFDTTAATSRGYIGFGASTGGSASTDFTLAPGASGRIVLGKANAAGLNMVVADGGVYMDGATGSAQGAGTINASGLYVNGVSVSASINGVVASLYKTTSTTRTSTASATADPHLVSGSLAAGVYRVDVVLWSSSFGGGGFRYDIVCGGGSESTFSRNGTNFKNTSGTITTTFEADVASGAFLYNNAFYTGLSSAQHQHTHITSCAAGTIGVHWAQETSNGTGFALGAGSSLIITKLN